MLKHKEHADVMQADLAAAVVPKKKKKETNLTKHVKYHNSLDLVTYFFFRYLLHLKRISWSLTWLIKRTGFSLGSQIKQIDTEMYKLQQRRQTDTNT